MDPDLIVRALAQGSIGQACSQGRLGQQVLLGSVVVMVRVSVHMGHLQTQILMVSWNPPGYSTFGQST